MCEEMGTFGRLSVGEFSCYSIERPWLDNTPRESCIPAGCYLMTKGRYNRGGYDAYEIEDVPRRSLIKIHVANIMTDVLGCIGLGTELGVVSNKWAVLNSRRAFDGFMEALDGDAQAIINITWATHN